MKVEVCSFSGSLVKVKEEDRSAARFEDEGSFEVVAEVVPSFDFSLGRESDLDLCFFEEDAELSGCLF